MTGTRNDSSQVIKQNVWGIRYVDDLVQTAVNTDYETDNSVMGVSDEQLYALQDANYNVVAIIDAAGVMVERYEYDPYGRRQVFIKGSADDEWLLAPMYASRRVGAEYQSNATNFTSTQEAWGLNEFGHQGLMHDEELGLIYNRARMLNVGLGRFNQRDWNPDGIYNDGGSLYAYARNAPLFLVDPSGLVAIIDKPRMLSTGKLVDVDANDESWKIFRPATDLGQAWSKKHQREFGVRTPIVRLGAGYHQHNKNGDYAVWFAVIVVFDLDIPINNVKSISVFQSETLTVKGKGMLGLPRQETKEFMREKITGGIRMIQRKDRCATIVYMDAPGFNTARTPEYEQFIVDQTLDVEVNGRAVPRSKSRLRIDSEYEWKKGGGKLELGNASHTLTFGPAGDPAWKDVDKQS